MSSPRAFTLAEVVMAIGILAFAFVTVITLMVGGLRQLEQSNQYSQAQSLARQQLESIRSQGYALDSCLYDGRIPNPPVAGFPPPPYPGVSNEQPYKIVVKVDKFSSRLCNCWVDVYWGPRHHLRAESIVHL